MNSSLVQEDNDISSTPVNHKMLYIGWGAMVVGMFIAILDIQIVASSLNEIQAGLSISPDDIGWVQTSYLIAEVIMIPFSAFLSKLLSTRRAFMISAIGFTFMSLVCSFAWSLESMMVFRALQGFIGGAMIPGAFATAYVIFPKEKRTLSNIIIGMVVTMAPAIGPSLGGFLTENFSWRWLFLINIIPGILVALAVYAMPDIDKPDRSLLKRFDASGFIFMALFLGSLQYVLDEGPKEDWFDNYTILFFTIVCAVSAILFIWRSITYSSPIVSFRAFHNRNFAVGCLFSFIVGFGLVGVIYTTPLYLGRVAGLNALQIGEIMGVTGLFMFIGAPTAGQLADKVDVRPLLAFGFSMFALGLYINSQHTAEARFWEFALSQSIWGFGMMFIFVPINNLTLGTLAPDELKDGSGLYNLMRNLGGAIGLAVINTLLDSRADFHRNWLSQWVNPSRPEYQSYVDSLKNYLGAAPSDTVMLKMIDGIISRESMVLAFNDVHFLMAMLFALSLLLIPLARKPKHQVILEH